MMRLSLLLVPLALLAGCASTVSTQLPDLKAPDRSVMSSAEQERAIREMKARKDTYESKAIEAISKSK